MRSPLETPESARLYRDLPAYARPVWMRAGIRLNNGMPFEKVRAAFGKELAAAKRQSEVGQ